MMDWLIQDSRRLEHIAHPSTEMALAAMRALAAEGFAPRRILDIGCGSGLLSLAAAELWPEASIIAGDISAQAVADTQANIDRYELGQRIRVLRSDALSHPEIVAAAPHDLILANLLAEILISSSRDLMSALKPRGIALLAGILAWRGAQVQAAYKTLGAVIEQEFLSETWQALRIRRM